MSMEEDIRLGEAAKRLLDDELVIKLFGDIKTMLLGEIAASEPDEHDRREELYFEIQGVEHLMTRLKGVADSGYIARHRRDKL